MPCCVMPCLPLAYSSMPHAVRCHPTPLSATLCHTVPCHVAPLCYAVPYHTMLCHTIPYCAVPYHVIPYCAVSCHNVLCHAILFHAILCHTTPHCTLPHHHTQCHMVLCHAKQAGRPSPSSSVVGWRPGRVGRRGRGCCRRRQPGKVLLTRSSPPPQVKTRPRVPGAAEPAAAASAQVRHRPPSPPRTPWAPPPLPCLSFPQTLHVWGKLRLGRHQSNAKAGASNTPAPLPPVCPPPRAGGCWGAGRGSAFPGPVAAPSPGAASSPDGKEIKTGRGAQ